MSLRPDPMFRKLIDDLKSLSIRYGDSSVEEETYRQLEAEMDAAADRIAAYLVPDPKHHDRIIVSRHIGNLMLVYITKRLKFIKFLEVFSQEIRFKLFVTNFSRHKAK